MGRRHLEEEEDPLPLSTNSHFPFCATCEAGGGGGGRLNPHDDALSRAQNLKLWTRPQTTNVSTSI